MLAFLEQVTQSNGTQFKKSVVSKLYSPEAEPKPEISVHVLYKGCTVWRGKKKPVRDWTWEAERVDMGCGVRASLVLA